MALYSLHLLGLKSAAVVLIAVLKLYTTLLQREEVSTAGVHPGHTQSFNSHSGTMRQYSPGALLSRTAQHSHVGGTLLTSTAQDAGLSLLVSSTWLSLRRSVFSGGGVTT
jgi:hypothetical protein